MAKLDLQVAATDSELRNETRGPAGPGLPGHGGEPTSEENMVAQVPMHQHTTGLVILPSTRPWQIRYSSVPPIWGGDQNR